MLYFTPFPLLAGFATLAVLLSILWYRKRSLSHLFFFSAFWVYLLILISVTIFPIPLDGGYGFDNIGEQITFMQRVKAINLIPLYFGTCWELPRPCVIGIYQNILMTVPFGFGVSFIARLKTRGFLWLAITVGLVIEAAQFALDLAISGAYRTVDANDVLFNALGVLLGYGVFRVFSWLYLVITQYFKITDRGLLSYIHDVACQAQAVEPSMRRQT